MSKIFNTPIEIGIRIVYILSFIYPKKIDLYTLPYLDYALIYSEDFNGPKSLHTLLPLRGGEYLSRISIIEKALMLMKKRGFIQIELSDNGLLYYAGENAHSITDLINCSYANELKEKCIWLKSYLEDYNLEQLKDYFKKNGLNWGAQLLTNKQELL